VQRRRVLLACGLFAACGGCLGAPGQAQVRREWLALAAEAGRLAARARVDFVNRAVNQRMSYRARSAEPGRLRWRLPEESLAERAGDCSDYAIAKFFLLLAGGAPEGSVRLCYAIQRPPDLPGLRRPHLVTLARQPASDPLVLDIDNLLVIPLSLRSDLEPVFSFDRERLHAGFDGADRGSATATLKPWGELIARRDAAAVPS